MKRLFMMAIAVIFSLPSLASAAEKSLKIINRREAFPILFVYITPAGESDWGQDQLRGEIIKAGESHSWNIPWDGCYVDVKARTFTGLGAERRNLDVCGGVEWVLYDENQKQQTKTLKIINRREAFPIWKVFITPAGTQDWGEDQLGDDAIDAGDSHTWTITWDGCYVDVKAVTFTGISTESRNVDVCGGMVWTIVDTNPKD